MHRLVAHHRFPLSSAFTPAHSHHGGSALRRADHPCIPRLLPGRAGAGSRRGPPRRRRPGASGRVLVLLTAPRGDAADPSTLFADVDVQVAGPALALFFAALGARGSPPSISSPDGSFSLTTDNCPDTFRNAFSLWQRTVQPVQGFSSTARHDLALLLCDKEVHSSPLRLDVARIAADLKGIALEILQVRPSPLAGPSCSQLIHPLARPQRRTFQMRFRNDLQAALDTSVRPRTSTDTERPHAAYEPPPMYHEGEPTTDTKRAHQHLAQHDAPEANAGAAAGAESLALIRETLYAALGDVMVETPAILSLLARGADYAPQAFFASTALAILDVALTRVDEHGVRPVHFGHGSPTRIGLGDTPRASLPSLSHPPPSLCSKQKLTARPFPPAAYLRPLLGGLVELSQASRALQDEDDARAVREATEGAEQLTPPRLDQLRERLAQGVGATEEQDEQVQVLANGVSQLALGASLSSPPSLSAVASPCHALTFSLSLCRHVVAPGFPREAGAGFAGARRHHGAVSVEERDELVEEGGGGPSVPHVVV